MMTCIPRLWCCGRLWRYSRPIQPTADIKQVISSWLKACQKNGYLESQAIVTQATSSLTAAISALITTEVSLTNSIQPTREQPADRQTLLIYLYFSLCDIIENYSDGDIIFTQKTNVIQSLTSAVNLHPDKINAIMELLLTETLEQHNSLGTPHIVTAQLNPNRIAVNQNKRARYRQAYRTDGTVVKAFFLFTKDQGGLFRRGDLVPLLKTIRKEMKYNENLGSLHDQNMYYCPINKALYFIMPDLGQTLKTFMWDKYYNTDNNLSFKQQCDLARNLCLLICHHHEKGMAHTDLKPSNITIELDKDSPDNLSLATLHLIDLESAGPPKEIKTDSFGTTGWAIKEGKPLKRETHDTHGVINILFPTSDGRQNKNRHKFKERDLTIFSELPPELIALRDDQLQRINKYREDITAISFTQGLTAILKGLEETSQPSTASKCLTS